MRFFLGISLGVVACLVLLEGLLRFLPVNSGIRMDATSMEKPFSSHLPNQQYLYSYGWAMGNVRHGVTNSRGFTNSPNSSKKGGVLVIGDSFIESLMHDFPNTVQGHLEEKFPEKVQAISASSNGLADSLQILKYFTPEIEPTVAVLFVETTDVSLLLQKPDVGHNGFIITDKTAVSITHDPYTESPKKVIALRSALVRYLYYNLKAVIRAMKLSQSVFGNTQVSDDSDHLPEKEVVLNYYFSQLRSLSAANHFRVVLLLDGDRKAIYSNGHDLLWKPEDRQLFLNMALKYGLDVVDMQPAFERHWEQKHERMDFFPMDGHWNSVAHKLAADEVIKLLNTQ